MIACDGSNNKSLPNLILVGARNHLGNPRLDGDGPGVLVDEEPSVSDKRLELQVLVLWVADLEGVYRGWILGGGESVLVGTENLGGVLAATYKRCRKERSLRLRPLPTCRGWVC
jgi:hypothetical protein